MPYNYLPGFDVSIRDGGLVVPRPEFSTGSLLIICPQAPATVGPQEVNIAMVNSQTAFEQFGTANRSNPMFRAWKQAIDAGCQDVRLLELKGTTADERYVNLHKIYNNLEDYIVDAIVVAGVYADDEITAPVLPEVAEVDYPAFSENARIVVENEVVIESALGMETKYTLKNAPIVPGTVRVTIDGISVSDVTVNHISGEIELAEAAEESAKVEATYAYVPRTFASQLAGLCRVVSNRVKQTLGFMALKPVDGTATLESINTYIKGAVEQKYDGLLSVVAGPRVIFSSADGNYVDSGIVAYAGFAVMLPPQSAPTNKILPGAVGLEYNLSPAQLDSMCSKNIVTFRAKSGRIVVTDAITTAGLQSDFTRLTTMRVTNEAVEAIRTVADPFIGEPNDLPQQNALNTAIRSALDALVKAGALRAYKFAIKATLEDIISGRMQIELEMVPAFELKKINITVALRATL